MPAEKTSAPASDATESSDRTAAGASVALANASRNIPADPIETTDAESEFVKAVCAEASREVSGTGDAVKVIVKREGLMSVAEQFAPRGSLISVDTNAHVVALWRRVPSG